MTYRTRIATAVFAVLAVIGGLVVPMAVSPVPASALSGSEFDAGYIISDENFYNGAAMSEAEIQRFLERQVGTCANSNCLPRYTENTPSRTWSFGTCAPYQGAAGESAARIIFKVQQACNLSAKVILVTLQKEQSLLTDSAPTDGVMRKAMGYGCPDTSTCDSTYYGFFNQVFAAGRQLTWYSNPAGSFTSIRIGEVNSVRYHPNAACGSKSVRVQNKATAALYYYTPYTPNAAALNNLYGTGDACSAYGNRNFWRMYNDWFGSPTGDPGRSNPIGNFEFVAATPGAFRVSGWALDPDTAESLSIHVYVGSVGSAHAANLPRNDVGAAYPGNGPNHGFDVSVPAQGAGDTSVCVYAINLGPGANVLLGCATRTAKSGSPVGALTDVRTTATGVEVSGWTLDPDTTTPITIHAYVDSVSSAHTAGRTSTAVPAAYAEYGTDHGFKESLAATPGPHDVCVYAINAAAGGHVQLGCKQVVVPGAAIPEQGRSPIGVLEMARGGTGTVEVSGWAIDPDTAQPIQIHVYADSVGAATTANGERSDIGAAYPLYGAKHGFSHSMTAPPGTRNVCVYAINAGPGAHTLLGCRSVDVNFSEEERGRAPIGALESAVVDSSGITAIGWAIDPDTAQPIQVHVYVDSTGFAVNANAERADVAAANPGYGSAHGFSYRMAASPGAHTVCAYGINAGPGGHTQLGCKTVVVPGGSMPDLGRAPFGFLDAVVAKSGSVDVGGWAIDPDTNTPIQVHVYVDSFGVAVLADGDRPDVAAHYPAYGASHGYWTTVPAAAGPHTVCAYAINNGAGGHTALGCAAVTVLP